MFDKNRGFSASLFVLVLLALMLPFARVTCSGEEVARLSGYEIAFGKQFKAMANSGEQRKAGPNPLALLVVTAAVVGLLCCLKGGRESTIARSAAGGTGLILVLLLAGDIGNKVGKEGQGMLKVEFLIGYWLCLLLFAGAGLASLLPMLKEAPGATLTTGPPPSPGPNAAHFCGNCGARASPGGSYCPECGAEIEETQLPGG